jgi:hypothetical protein
MTRLQLKQDKSQLISPQLGKARSSSNVMVPEGEYSGPRGLANGRPESIPAKGGDSLACTVERAGEAMEKSVLAGRTSVLPQRAVLLVAPVRKQIFA